MVSEVLGLLRRANLSFETSSISSKQLGSLLDCIHSGLISGKIAKSVLDLMAGGDKRLAEDILQEKGWKTISDHNSLSFMIEALVSENLDKV